MRNRAVTYSLFGVIFLLFLAYFFAHSAFFHGGEPIEDYLNAIIKYTQQDRWLEAEESVEKLIEIWNKEKYLISINYAEADYSIFMDNLSRIQGAIKTKDDTEAVSQALAALELWNNFIKIIPEP